MRSSILVICLAVAALLGVGFFFAHQHFAAERRGLVSTVTHQLDGHSAQIATLLTTMCSSNVATVEEAAFQELQAIPSTSLISRSMIRVAPAGDGRLECVIDTGSLGIPPRTIRSSQ